MPAIKLPGFLQGLIHLFNPLLVTLIAILGFASLISCELQLDTPPKFPNTDIVFQSVAKPGTEMDLRLGFVNADGSGLTYISVTAPSVTNNKSSPIYPQITSDNSILIVRGASATGHPGRLALYPPGKNSIICTTYPDIIIGPHSLTADQNYVVAHLTSPPGRIAKFDLRACLLGDDEVVTEFNIPPRYQPCPAGGGALSPNEELLAFPDCTDESAEIIVLDIRKGTGISVGNGIAPAWSPDGDWIAYRGLDGIYTVSLNGTNERRLVEYRIPEGIGVAEDWPPIPSWSPDGQWLTYHKCTLPSWPDKICTSIEDFAIFKVNIETGEEIKILDGGLNPYWRWQQDAP